ncbi:hypothetical protein A3I35_00170 [Candidatus Falkowbacteria bacterium RIFCSPLOWO2_02_FULL_45_15]|uniref:DUF8128 domain-containing protein n=2 Tax=Candidatus Falkowiibacteriota TaxID=1752728 RepID=A0A1F5RXC7_9BACT|nr:MAG: hypothetical protein A3D54_02990 [Candidatus Falkowbacteria bacterium RIFCSPHIGHO2_02_FULL_45_15]OGF19261.1 MAG: hypothetical protein A3I35_00170 [Candidatus Falkowbacteria bacterium RIFCSPLOWO2_02_FULL_45_15]
MDVVINLDKIMSLLELPADILVARIFLYFGWAPISIFLLWSLWRLWIFYIQNNFADKREFILLAIDIPQGNEQSPRAVEHMFAHLAGAHATINLIEKYWEGQTQDSFSFEVVSIDGYTQYLVRGEKKYRDLIEAMVYAQYPEAEITEVDDYTASAPDRFPDENYDIWGGEWILQKASPYPIRTYLDFEHQFSGEFKDPNAALIELFSSLRRGEQCWYQIIVTPKGFEWEEEGYDEISKVIGEKVGSEDNIFDKTIDLLMKGLTGFSELIIPLWGEIEAEEEKREVNMLNLRPVQKKSIEAIQQKISKIGFDIKIRFIYLAAKEVFDKRRANSFVGVMKQYTMSDLNSYKPDMDVTVTSAKYLWKSSRLSARKNRLIRAYKKRSNWRGRLPGILNIEELATLWHFPIEEAVKAPMLQKVPSRKSAAPSYLPVEGSTSDLASEFGLPGITDGDAEKEEIFSLPQAGQGGRVRQTEPPANLPIG